MIMIIILLLWYKFGFIFDVPSKNIHAAELRDALTLMIGNKDIQTSIKTTFSKGLNMIDVPEELLVAPENTPTL